MAPAGRGRIVIISPAGGPQCIFSAPCGVGKAACDRRAADCAQEPRPQGPGLVRTELLKDHREKKDNAEDPC